jgi:uncharacterized membrane protein
VDPAFHTAMPHFYRAEMHRMTVWRTRLDTTTNWAVLLTAGMTTFALGSQETPHFSMLLALALDAICMLFEARRYQHLHHSKARLRLLEGSYFSTLLGGEPSDSRWQDKLVEDLVRPRFTLTLLTAVRLRLRRNYLLLVWFATAVWLTKLFIHPTSPEHLEEFFRRLAVGDMLPPWFVAASALAFLVTATALAVFSPSEEELEGWAPTGSVPSTDGARRGTD